MKIIPTHKKNKLRNALQHCKMILPVLFLLIMNSTITKAQVSGTAFRDYNGNGTKGTTTPNLEPGVQGIVVNAFNSSDAIIASYTTGATGTYSIPASGGAYNGTPGSNTGFVASGTAVRIEFVIPSNGCTALPDYDFSSLSGAVYGTSVQFGTSPIVNANYAINYPAEYASSTNPSVATSIFTAGNVTASGGGANAGTFQDAVKVSYNTFATSVNNTPANTQIATSGEMGSVWGIAYSKQADRLLYASVIRRHFGLGPNGSGAIYMANPNATTGASLFCDLDALGFPTRATGIYAYQTGQPNYGGSPGQANTNNIPFTGVIGTNTERGLPGTIPTVYPGVATPPLYASYDAAALAQIGKVSLGGLDITDDGSAVFVMNLYDKKLYKINIANPNSLSPIVSAGDVTSYSLPGITATNGQLRPWAVKYYKGKVYVGVVADASSDALIGGLTTGFYNDLKGYLLEFDVASSSFSGSPVATINFNYTKQLSDVTSLAAAGGSVNRAHCARYNKWNDDYDNFRQDNTVENEKLCFPQPIISDFEFDELGNIIVAVSDRGGFQVGYRNFSPSDLAPDGALGSVSTNNGRSDVSSGDVIKIIKSTSPCGYVPEAMVDGSAGSEFFAGDFYNSGGTLAGSLKHAESSAGAITILPGSQHVSVIGYDPVTSTNTGGIYTINTSTGARANNGTTYYGENLYSDANRGVTCAKGIGLGDIEILSSLPCLEVGNRIWNDTNGNGIQDAGENGINSVGVELYAADGTTLLGTATSSGDGNYYFDCSNVTNGLSHNTSYVLKIAGANYNGTGAGALAGLDVTATNATGNGEADWSDNDASVVSSRVQISFATGVAGQNDHNLDFGFHFCNASLNAVVTDAACNGNTDASIDVTVSGTNGTVTYLWNDGATTDDRTGLAAGNYSVTATDGAGCTASGSFTVNEPAALTAGATHTDATTVGGNDGTIDLSVSGGTTPYTYLWNDGITTEDRSALVAGTYSVTVTDAHGCSATVSVNIGELGCVESSMSIPAQYIIGTPYYGNGNFNAIVLGNLNSASIGGGDCEGKLVVGGDFSTPGTYSVGLAVVGNNPPPATDNLIVQGTHINGATNWAVGGNAVLCAATGTAITHNSGTTRSQCNVFDYAGLAQHYQNYSTCLPTLQANGTVAQSFNDVTLSGSDAVLNVFNVTLNYGGSITYHVNVPASSDVVINVSGTSAAISNGTWVYSPGNAWASGHVLLNLYQATSYSSTNIDFYGAVLAPFADLTLHGGSIGGVAMIGGNVTQESGGEFHNFCFEANIGCTVPLSVSAVPSDATCNGALNGAVDATVSGGVSPYTYLWDNGATTEDLSGIAAGTYGVTVTDANGATASTSALVGEPSAMSAICDHIDVTINGGSNGSASVSTSGGTTPYTYLWSNGATTSSISGLSSGSYSVTVTDAHGCESTCSSIVNEPGALNANAIADDAACNGDSNGNVNLTVTGGVTPYTYLWSNGATTEDLSGVAAGNYSVTVTDDNGATASASATVGEPPVLSATCDHTDVTTNNGSDGTVSVSVTGGTGPYTYLWSNGATTSSVSGLSGGTYSVTVTDDHGCQSGCSSIVNDHLCSISVTASADFSKCHAEPTMMTASSSDQGATFSWSPATGLSNANIANPVTDVHATTTYTVTATGSDGCMATDEVTVTVYPVVNAKITIKPNTQSCGAPCMKLFTKNNPNYTYVWRRNGQPIIGAPDKNTYCACVSGTYSVQVTDGSSGCTHTSKKIEITIVQKLEEGDGVSAKSEMALNAWPNPTTEQLNVTLTNGVEGAVNVQLMDMFGRELRVTSLNGSREEQTITFNLNGLAAGMYIVRVQNGDKRMEQKVMLIK